MCFQEKGDDLGRGKVGLKIEGVVSSLLVLLNQVLSSVVCPICLVVGCPFEGGHCAAWVVLFLGLLLVVSWLVECSVFWQGIFSGRLLVLLCSSAVQSLVVEFGVRWIGPFVESCVVG